MSATNTAKTNRLAGIASFTVAGVTHFLQGELTYSPSDVERETLAGMDQVHGFKETPKAPFIAGTLRDNGKLRVADFTGMTSVNVVVSLANGKTVIGSDMWCVSAQEVKAAEGTFEVRFEGLNGSVTEQ